jgi:hypothetical protein
MDRPFEIDGSNCDTDFFFKENLKKDGGVVLVNIRVADQP